MRAVDLMLILVFVSACSFSLGILSTLEPSPEDYASAKGRTEWIASRLGFDLCGAGAVGPVSDLTADDVKPTDRYGRETVDYGRFQVWWNKVGKSLFDKWEAKTRGVK